MKRHSPISVSITLIVSISFSTTISTTPVSRFLFKILLLFFRIFHYDISTYSTAGATFSAISRGHGRLSWWWCLFISVVDKGTRVTIGNEEIPIGWHPNIRRPMNELGLSFYVLDDDQNTLWKVFLIPLYFLPYRAELFPWNESSLGSEFGRKISLDRACICCLCPSVCAACSFGLNKNLILNSASKVPGMLAVHPCSEKNLTESWSSVSIIK